ncbi:MAG TPA: hypothetical protein PLP11_09415 [Bacteroidales bacterium]|nr:hypothetical protein [Bacteroidales bacterium]
MKKQELFSSAIIISILFFACSSSKKNYVGFVSNEFFVGMDLGEFKNKAYGFYDYELSDSKQIVYTEIKDVKSDTIYTITESYYFNAENKKLISVKFLIVLNEFLVNNNNYKEVLDNYFKNKIYTNKVKIEYLEVHYPTIVLTW